LSDREVISEEKASQGQTIQKAFPNPRIIKINKAHHHVQVSTGPMLFFSCPKSPEMITRSSMNTDKD